MSPPDRKVVHDTVNEIDGVQHDLRGRGQPSPGRDPARVTARSRRRPGPARAGPEPGLPRPRAGRRPPRARRRVPRPRSTTSPAGRRPGQRRRRAGPARGPGPAGSRRWCWWMPPPSGAASSRTPSPPWSSVTGSPWSRAGPRWSAGASCGARRTPSWPGASGPRRRPPSAPLPCCASAAAWSSASRRRVRPRWPAAGLADARDGAARAARHRAPASRWWRQTLGVPRRVPAPGRHPRQAPACSDPASGVFHVEHPGPG